MPNESSESTPDEFPVPCLATVQMLREMLTSTPVSFLPVGHPEFQAQTDRANTTRTEVDAMLRYLGDHQG